MPSMKYLSKIFFSDFVSKWHGNKCVFTIRSTINSFQSEKTNETMAGWIHNQFIQFHWTTNQEQIKQKRISLFHFVLKMCTIFGNTELCSFDDVVSHFSDVINRQRSSKFVDFLFKFSNSFWLGLVDMLLCLTPERIVQRVHVWALCRLWDVREPRDDPISENSSEIVHYWFCRVTACSI